MSFSHAAAMNVVPLMARIVLAAAFIPAGFGKLFNQAEFSESQAKRLNELGVATTPVTKTSAWLGPQVQIRLAVFQAEAEQPAEADKTPALVDDSKVDAPQPAPPEATPPPSTEGPKHTARALHQITLMVDGLGLPYPAHQAWLAGLTEFLGGILIFVGLLSRLWGLGLAVVMGMAFYMTSLNNLDTYYHVKDTDQFNMLFCQLGLFVLAFGVFLTGPGRLSLDRMLFGRSSPSPQPKMVTQPPPSPRPM